MNSIGRLFRVHIFGESHGEGLGVVVDGCPAGIDISLADFEEDLNRRRAGAFGTTSRVEEDLPEIVSGVFNGHTTGAPIMIVFRNTDKRSKDYEAIRNSPRPGHADFVLDKKYKGYNDFRGGGHSSGRLTLALVAAGIIAKKVIPSIKIQATLMEAGGNPNIEQAIEQAITNQDSIGGVVACQVNGLPIGLGEPFFDSLESVISHLVFSIPAIKGISFGAGFAAAKMTGSEHNDAIMDGFGATKTNHSGGINGGISNGNELFFEVVVKPTSSTPRQQNSWNTASQTVESFTIKGRHDLCIALRVPVVIEAAAAIALADFVQLSQRQ
jgi:chorismate synthase